MHFVEQKINSNKNGTESKMVIPQAVLERWTCALAHVRIAN